MQGLVTGYLTYNSRLEVNSYNDSEDSSDNPCTYWHGDGDAIPLHVMLVTAHLVDLSFIDCHDVMLHLFILEAPLP